MNAQVKLKPKEQAALDVKLANRRTDVFWIERSKGRDELEDEIQLHVHTCLADILGAYQTGDDCQIGRIIANCIGAVGSRIYYTNLAREVKEDLLPSWEQQ